MNAHVNVLNGFEPCSSREREITNPPVGAIPREKDWDPEEFARQQIRGLVRQVFFGNDSGSTRQVVFSAVEANTDVGDICERVGEALALETRAHIAIVRRESRGADQRVRFSDCSQIKNWSEQISGNLWRVPGLASDESDEAGTGHYWLSCLAELRNEFEYAVIHAPAAGISSEAAMLGQLADGIILVLQANSTRRAPARKIKESLGGQSRILGTVLSQRRFPVPQRIYRRF